MMPKRLRMLIGAGVTGAALAAAMQGAPLATEAKKPPNGGKVTQAGHGLDWEQRVLPKRPPNG